MGATPLPRLEHLTFLTLSLGFSNDVSFLALAEATFGPDLVHVNINLEASSAITEAGVDRALDNLPSTLSFLEIASDHALRPRHRLLPRFPHLSHFLFIAHRDPVDILDLLPPNLRTLSVALPLLVLVQRSNELRDRRAVFFADLLRRVEQNQLGSVKSILIKFSWDMEEVEQVNLERAAASRSIRIVSGDETDSE